MKRRALAFFAAAALIVSLAGCGEAKDPGDTPGRGESTPPPYNSYYYEHGRVTIGVPFSLPETPEDTGDSVVFTDPEGLWSVRFEPMSFRDTEINEVNLNGMYEKNKDFGYYQNVSKEDLSASFAGGKYRVSYIGLERNPDWVEAEQGYTASYTMANAFYIVNFGDLMVGPWGGMLIHVYAPEHTKDPLASILEDEDVKTLLGHLVFDEGSTTLDVSIPGLTAHFPAKWSGGSNGDNSVWASVNGDTRGSIFFGSSIYDDPRTAAGYITEQYQTLRFGDREWYGAVRTSQLAEKTLKSLELFTAFTEYHALSMKLNLNDWAGDEDFWRFAETESFRELMASLELDPASFHNPEDDRKDAAGFACNNIGEISAYTGGATELVIPAAIGTNAIVGVNTGVFKDNHSIVSVELAEGISYIESEAFAGCTALKTVVLPDSLSYIGSSAFEGCTALERVVFGKGLAEIDDYAFSGCASLGEVLLPGTVREIDHHAFWNAGSGRFDCPAEATAYGAMALAGSGFDSVVFGPGADLSEKSILQDAAARSVTVGAGTRELGEYFLYATGDGSRLEELSLPASLESIGKYALRGCRQLKAVDLQAVQTLGDSAFYGTGLVELTIPGSVKHIPFECFACSPDLMRIHIEEGVETIGEYAFSECGRHYPDKWNYMFSDKDILTEYPGSVVNGTDPFDRFINVWMPATLQSVGRGAFSAVFLEGLYLEWCTSPDMLPQFDENSFTGSRVMQFYFTRETIEACGGALDAALLQLDDVGDSAWYYEGAKPYWRTEPFS